MDIQGTAVGFAMTGVPIGILACNAIFGYIYDTNLSQGTLVCYGSACFQESFQIFTGIQVVAVITSLLLLVLRLKQRIAHAKAHYRSMDMLDGGA
ncbi:hypothetical protein HDU98_007040 [Podochytrium sp. JEL0797]|nr:hypothetical protein HDU98_007040 [Podochytrium sp. JEL0797]